MVAVLGGSFDPVHNGHVALGNYFSKLLFPDQLRILPAGNPWQKRGLEASPQQRVEMVALAFGALPVPVDIDLQEMNRTGKTYTIDTLLALRAELGPQASIAFLIGADQLLKLHTWKRWTELFDCAHICAASRPGCDMSLLPTEVAREFRRRAGTPEQLRATPAGLTCLATNLEIDISATAIRAALHRGEDVKALVPPAVLDYIRQHHLYSQ